MQGYLSIVLHAHLDERQIRFRDGFKQPAFLQKFFMLRVTHKWQVRVEDE